MYSDILYIHLDTVTNHVLLKGFSMVDFSAALRQKPENILLLDPHGEDGEFEPHTGFKVIKDQAKVKSYFETISRRKNSECKWIDFDNLNVLKQLTPLEISELLYFGHTNSHLHSPFFYKLQNDYVYLDVGNDTKKIYYRYLEQFYYLLGRKITGIFLEKLNDKKSFFKRTVPVEGVPLATLKDLQPLLREGAVFSFSQLKQVHRRYEVPIYLVEDRMRIINSKSLAREEKIASLIYDASKKTWTLEQAELLDKGPQQLHI